MIWLLENELFDNLDELKSEIVQQGHQYITAKYVPFGGRLEIDGRIPDSGHIFVYGSLQFVKTADSTLYRRYGNRLHTWCNLPQFKCSYYYPRLSKYLLNRECAFLPFGQLQDAGEWIFKTFGINGTKIFMRPNSGFKEFTGQVYDSKYWDGFLRCSNIALQPEDLVVISTPKELVKEYRAIIGPTKDNERQQVVTISRTHSNGQLDEGIPSAAEHKQVTEYITSVLDDVCFEPNPLWVMDVCSDINGNFTIVEVNSMSCSGYYKCDMQSIVQAVSEYICTL